MTLGGISQHLAHDLGDLILEFVDKLGSVVVFALDVAELLLPDTRQFATGEELFAYGLDKLDSRGRRHEVFALASDVVAFEECLDDACARGRSSDAVLLHSRTQLLVLNKFSSRLHGTQERGLCVIFRWRGLLLGQRRFVRACLPLDEGRQHLLLVVLLLRLLGHLVERIDHAPARLENLLARCLEFYVAHLAHHGCRGKLAVGVEDADEAARHEVIDMALVVGEPLRNDTRGNDGVVVRNLGGIEDPLRLAQLRAPQRLDQFGIRRLSRDLHLEDPIEDLRTLGIDIIAEILRIDTRIGGVFVLIERLDEVERHFGGEAKLLVAVHLQRREVIELTWRLRALLLLHARHLEGQSRQ